LISSRTIAGAFELSSLVAGERRSAELVVKARGKEIDIHRNMVGDEEAGG